MTATGVTDWLEGGCACGAIRYRLRKSYDAGICHCSTCQKTSGSAFLPWASVEDADFELLRGVPRFFASSASGERAFCPDCGAQLYFRPVGGGRVAAHLGTLDHPSAVLPKVHLFAPQQARWLKLHDLLPWVEDNRLDPPERRTYYRKPADPRVNRHSVIELKPVTAENVSDVLLLDVSGHQRRFVAPTSTSIAQAHFRSGVHLRAITAGDVVVGFASFMLQDQAEGDPAMVGQPYLWRFLIDERYQGLGLGRRALLQIIEETAGWGDFSAFWLSCVPGNDGPYQFYRRLGFEDTGKMDEDEIVLRRPLR